MKNADSIKRRLEEIKNMEDQKAALSALADIQYDIGISACEERTQLRKQVEELRAVLVGNGDPANSVLARLGGVEFEMSEIGKGIKEIKELLQGGLKSGDSGLIDRVRQNEKCSKNINRVLWLILTIVVGVLVETVLRLI